jgi:hypothetical protein
LSKLLLQTNSKSQMVTSASKDASVGIGLTKEVNPTQKIRILQKAEPAMHPKRNHENNFGDAFYGVQVPHLRLQGRWIAA